MCGIAGFILHRSQALNNPNTALLNMTRRLAHRGPDGSGHHCKEPVFLGHRRLSIIGIADGAQPMAGDNGSMLTFNGEIYNYLEIRNELEARGRQFKTQSDTEVLLSALDTDGEACLENLNGMFAFAYWCPRRNTLTLARDRLGKKPLYYYDGPGFFAFASELKALLEMPEVGASLEIDARSISDFLSVGYILQPKSIYRNIQQLEPGHIARIQPGTPGLASKAYWSAHEAFLEDKLPPGRKTQEDFINLLDDAVRIRLRSDVPVTTFLSGGIDSAAVLASACKSASSRPSALCMGFGAESFDESENASLTASHLDVSFERLEHDSESNITLDNIYDVFDEPFADTSILPMMELTASASRKYKVALSGDGADEILAGYPTYRADRYYNSYRRVPNTVQRASKWFADQTLRPSYKKVSFDYKLKQFLASRGLSREEAHYWWRVIFSDEEKQCLLSTEAQQTLDGYNPFDVFRQYFDRVRGAGFLDRTLYVDTMTWLPSDILVKVDRTSMAHGLEVRTPFLDHRLVSFCARLPEKMKFDGQRQKVILRNAFQSRLPGKILSGPKRGFNAPTTKFSRTSLSPGAAGNMFDSRVSYDPAKEDMTFKGFSLSILDFWMRMADQSKRAGQVSNGE